MNGFVNDKSQRAQWKNGSKTTYVYKEYQVMTTGKTTSLKIDMKNNQVVYSFCILGSNMNNKGTSSQ